MRLHPHALLANRQAEAQASRAAIELRAAIDRERKARQTLRDAITAVGLPAHQGVALLAAVAVAKACAVADPEPASPAAGIGGAL